MRQNKKWRMKKVLNNENIDGLLCSLWRHLPETNRKGEYVVQDHIHFYRETDVDYIKIMSDGYFEYPLEYEIKKAEDWKKLQPLDENHPYFTEQVERVSQIIKELGTECMIYYTVFAAFSSIRFAVGDEMVMRHLTEDEEAVCHALEVIATDNGRLAEKVIRQGGCDGIYFCVQGGEKKRFSHEEYMRLISPSDLITLNRANEYSEWNLLHCCGWDGYQNHLENWKDYPARAVNWSVYVEKMDLLQGKKFFGGRTVIGGLSNARDSILQAGSMEQIEETIETLKARYQDVPGIILGADCSFASDLEIERISKVMEILHRK